MGQRIYRTFELSMFFSLKHVFISMAISTKAPLAPFKKKIFIIELQ